MTALARVNLVCVDDNICTHVSQCTVSCVVMPVYEYRDIILITLRELVKKCNVATATVL